MAAATRDRILDAALVSFGTRGYGATSLDALAAGLGITKQSILYHFASKELLLGAVVDRCAAELAAALEAGVAGAAPGWPRVSALVRAVFRVAATRPDVLALLREVTRLGAPAAAGLADAFEPLVAQAAAHLEREMGEGTMRPADARAVVLAAYAAVIGVATEVEVLRALGYEPRLRTLVRRRREILTWLHAELTP